jgi:hypothetical protein
MRRASLSVTVRAPARGWIILPLTLKSLLTRFFGGNGSILVHFLNQAKTE